MLEKFTHLGPGGEHRQSSNCNWQPFFREQIWIRLIEIRRNFPKCRVQIMIWSFHHINIHLMIITYIYNIFYFQKIRLKRLLLPEYFQGLRCRLCPFIQTLSWFHLNFIQILSWFNPLFIQILSRIFLKFNLSKSYSDFILILKKIWIRHIVRQAHIAGKPQITSV